MYDFVQLPTWGEGKRAETDRICRLCPAAWSVGADAPHLPAANDTPL